MNYRREIDGLRALAVLPVILFHAGFELFNGGFVGVDVFFVISGYLITTIICSELEQGSFSIINFYERRARRILPALFLVILVCIPFAWLWLLPSDMKDFSKSLIAVSAFASNIFFWIKSDYFDTAAELKPLLHTWSLAVEEQYYVLFPIFLVFFWRVWKNFALILLGLIFISSFSLAQWGSYSTPAAAFYLLHSRGWELIVGAFIALYLSNPHRIDFGRVPSEIGGWLGVILIVYAVFSYDKTIPFPGIYALAPTGGAALIILFAAQETTVGKFLGNKVFVGIGLISYSAYLWHQPLFAFARHGNLVEPSKILLATLCIASLSLAYISWRYVETPFRNKSMLARKHLFSIAFIFCALFISFGIAGSKTNGFKMRFDHIALPKAWDPPIKCHGAAAISKYDKPLDECLGASRNGTTGDIFLLGDSHAAQLTFPLKTVAQERGVGFNFINTEDEKDFPFAYFRSEVLTTDRIINHVLKVSDKGDIVVISFHRGHLNDSRDKHLSLSSTINENKKYRIFVSNMARQIELLADAGVRTTLIKDTPLLSDTSSIEACALYNEKGYSKTNAKTNFCSVKLKQDLHTRKRQSDAFDYLSNLFPDTVTVLDAMPVLYGDNEVFNPINHDGSYKMFDRHHLTYSESNRLTDLFRSSIR